jgi:Pentapeptide repeats (9 copies)
VAEFVCGVREKDPYHLSACKNLPEYRDTGYCVLHFPGEEKEGFEQVKKDKLVREDYDFSGTVFPEGTSDFSRFVFDGNADFTGATFIGEADFSFAQFSGAETYFNRAQFSGAGTYFQGAQFSGEWTYFQDAQFSGESTYFNGAQFGSVETSFQEATFAKEVYFTGVTFSEKVTFWGTQGNRVFAPGAWALWV